MISPSGVIGRIRSSISGPLPSRSTKLTPCDTRRAMPTSRSAPSIWRAALDRRLVAVRHRGRRIRVGRERLPVGKQRGEHRRGQSIQRLRMGVGPHADGVARRDVAEGSRHPPTRLPAATMPDRSGAWAATGRTRSPEPRDPRRECLPIPTRRRRAGRSWVGSGRDRARALPSRAPRTGAVQRPRASGVAP